MVKFYVKTITITIGTNVINVVENNCYSKTLGARRNDDTTVRDTSAAPRIGSHFFPKYNFIPIQPILTNIFWTKFLPNFSPKFLPNLDVFYKDPNLCPKFDPQNDFSERRISYNIRNAKICKHSNFSIIEQKYV